MERQLGWTTLEQSKKLVEAGLDPNTADMNYRYCICKCIDGEPKEDWLLGTCGIFEECPDEQILCWSLGALIELMPADTLNIRKADTYWNIILNIDKCHIAQFSKETLIETLCNVIEWLLENNYIKKGETK